MADLVLGLRCRRVLSSAASKARHNGIDVVAGVSSEVQALDGPWIRVLFNELQENGFRPMPEPGWRLRIRFSSDLDPAGALEEAKKLYVKSALRQIAKQMIEAGESLDLDHPRGTSEVGVGHIMA